MLRGAAPRHNSQKVVAQRAVAAYSGYAVGLHRHVRLDTKNYFHASSVAGIGADCLNTTHRRTAGVVHFGAGPQPASILEKRPVLDIAAIEKSGERKDGEDQQGGSNQDEQCDSGFFTAGGRGVHTLNDFLSSGFVSTNPETRCAFRVRDCSKSGGSISRRQIKFGSGWRPTGSEAESPAVIGGASELRRSAFAGSRSLG